MTKRTKALIAEVVGGAVDRGRFALATAGRCPQCGGQDEHVAFGGRLLDGCKVLDRGGPEADALLARLDDASFRSAWFGVAK